MKQYKSLREMIAEPAPSTILSEVTNLIRSCEDDGVNLNDELFVSLFGGDFFLVEKEDDLKEIFTMVEDETTGKWLNITEVASTFDEARYTEKGDFAVLCMITNNAGGPLWYIPREIADTCSNIRTSISLSNDGEIPKYSIS